MHTRQLIILCTLLGCSNSPALLADRSQQHHSPWAQHFRPDSHILQPSPSATPRTAPRATSQVTPRASTGTGKTLSSPAQLEAEEFNQAFEQLKAAKYSTAIEQFKQFIQRYPQSERRGEADYWIGEAHYLAKDYSQALTQFSHIIIKFANSELARQATLKSADTYRAMQDLPQAKLFYQRVIKNYPGTHYAVKATEQLRQLQ